MSHGEQCRTHDALARYDAVIHLRTPEDGKGYGHLSPLRTETSAEAGAIDRFAPVSGRVAQHAPESLTARRRRSADVSTTSASIAMSTLLIPSSETKYVVLPRDWPGGIFVATDGRTPADAALAAARKLAGPATFGIVAVLSASSSTDRVPSPVGTPQTIETLRDVVTAQLRKMFGDEADVPIEMRTGYPPAVLASFAETHGVSLLIVGVGRPRVLDRLLGDESTLRLARMTRTPVFAVTAYGHVPPRRILIGTDFSQTSLRAARLALSVAAPDAEVFVANVRGLTGRLPSEGALRRHAEALQTGFCGRVFPVELQGDPATELLAYASSRGVDAIAIGKHGVTLDGRAGMGPVATRIVRCASCSVLLAPPGTPIC